MLKIELTDEQNKQLEPHFDAVRAGNKKGLKTYIGAQIWADGMVVRLFSGEQGAALCVALGGDPKKTHMSADDRIGG